MAECLVCRAPARQVNLEAPAADIHGLLHLLDVVVWVGMIWRWVQDTRIESADKVGDPKSFCILERNVAMQCAVVQERCPRDASLSEDDHELKKRFNVVIGIKEWKAACQECKHYDASGPNVNGGRLILALEEDLGSAEATSSGSVGAHTGTSVFLDHADTLWRRHCLLARIRCHMPAALMKCPTNLRVRAEHRLVDSGLAVRISLVRNGMVTLAAPFLRVEALGQTKVAQSALSRTGIVKEVCGLHIAVDDFACMRAC